MIASHFRQLFQYNSWAWDRLFAGARRLDKADYYAERMLFSKTVHASLVHCLGAEYIWLERCNGRSPDALFTPETFASLEAIEEAWLPVREGWELFLTGQEDQDFAQPISYHNTRGDAFTLPLKDLCQHVINHATEHRSQLTPILYFAGAATEPLDYMLFCRSRAD
ncbi:MAG: DinB family protein [Candidatus Promineifilaceae bacterium]